MKLTLIIIASLASLIAISQVYIKKNTNDTEKRNYSVLKSFKKFEIRKYDSAIFTTVEFNSDSYSEISRNGFRILAGYIFGNNEENKTIAMTSPVVMQLDSVSTMKFMVPSNMKWEDLPKPIDQSIQFEIEEGKTMAAIKFSGWANDEKIEKYKKLLSEELAKNKIEHKGNFSYLGYNPPYEVANRLNEVVVELKNYN